MVKNSENHCAKLLDRRAIWKQKVTIIKISHNKVSIRFQNEAYLAFLV